MPNLLYLTKKVHWHRVGVAIWTLSGHCKCLRRAAAAQGARPALISVSGLTQPPCVDEYLGIIKRSPSPPQETCRNPPIPDWWVQQPSPGEYLTACAVVNGTELGFVRGRKNLLYSNG